MTTMIESPLEDRIEFNYIHNGSEEYQLKLGLLRTLYKFKEDPDVIAVSLGKKTKVKIKYHGTPWEELN